MEFPNTCDMRIFDLTGQFGWVRLTGATRVDFLHRMSTNHLLGLKAGEARLTALTTAGCRSTPPPCARAGAWRCR